MRRMPVVIAIVVLAAALALAQGNKDEEIRKIIKSRKVTLSFSDCSIANVVSFLQDISGLNIVIDPKCDSELTTTIRLRDITMENALKVMLQPLDLDYVVKNGAVFIATKKRIAELKGASQKKPPAGLEPGQLLLLLKDGSKLKGRVAIDIWKLKTAYGLLEIPSGEMRKIRLPHEAKEGEKSPAEDEVETIRFTVTGKLEIDKLEVDTGKGKLTIPKSEIKEILFPKAAAVKPMKEETLKRIKADFMALEYAIQCFYEDHGRFPRSLDGLIADPGVDGWNGPYIEKLPTNPWGQRYIFEFTGKKPLRYELKTLGADGKEGGEGENKDYSNLDFLKEK